LGDDVHVVNKDEISATNTVKDNSSMGVAKSVIPTATAKNKNKIDEVSLNEFLLSIVG
jgi:hypothetical protein